MKIPFYASFSLLAFYVGYKLINGFVIDPNEIILQVLGASFLLSILLYSFEIDNVRIVFQNGNKPGINIRKVIAFIIVLAFISTLFVNARPDAVDSAKEVALVILAFYFGAESSKQRVKNQNNPNQDNQNKSEEKDEEKE